MAGELTHLDEASHPRMVDVGEKAVTLALPDSPQSLVDATWDDLAPYFEALATVPLTGETVEDWLQDWSRLTAVVDEAGTLAMIAYTCDTADEAKEAANLRWSSEIFPKVGEQGVRLAKRLVDLGWTRDDMAEVIKEFRTDIEILATKSRRARPRRCNSLTSLSSSIA